MKHFDCVIVGAGVVGLSIARALAKAGHKVLLIEAADRLGFGISGRGSGVIHAGLYYEPGSLKARLCVAGRRLLYAFAEEHGVPYRALGKLVVATSTRERDGLESIATRAAANGVDNVAWLEGPAARKLEPALVCVAALLSPSSGVIDVGMLLRALQHDAEIHGAVAAFQAPLISAAITSPGFTCEIGGKSVSRVRCAHLVNAAGHNAPAIARAIEGMPGGSIPTGYFAKGNYFALDRPAPFQHLVYPVPGPDGLGVHLTLDVAGRPRFGPDVEWVNRLDDGVNAARAEMFYAGIRRWWPDLPEGSLIPSHAGCRPKIAPRGAPACDFRIDSEADHGVAGLVNLFGIESPGLTSALAIGGYVADLLT